MLELLHSIKTVAPQVADKRTVAAGEELCRLVRQELEAMGQPLQPPAAAQQAGGAAAAAGEPAAASGGKQEPAAGGKQQPPAQQQQQQQGSKGQQQQERQPRQQHESAEDVEGDFAGQFVQARGQCDAWRGPDGRSPHWCACQPFDRGGFEDLLSRICLPPSACRITASRPPLWHAGTEMLQRLSPPIPPKLPPVRALQQGPSTGKKSQKKAERQQTVDDEVAAFAALAATDGDDGSCKKKRKKAPKVVVF